LTICANAGAFPASARWAKARSSCQVGLFPSICLLDTKLVEKVALSPAMIADGADSGLPALTHHGAQSR
jgi:hypothetical protein